MSPYTRSITLSAVLFFVLPNIGINQSTYQLADSEKAAVEVTGTSTLHGWKAVAGKFGFESGSLELNAEATTIEDFYFYVEVASLDGGRGSAMNNKIKGAFNADVNPKIEYRQSEPATVSEVKSDQTFTIISKGSLTMAGESRDIELTLTGEKTDAGLKISTLKEMKMSDFNIEPPSAMFGQIVCGDDIKVMISLSYDVVTE